MKLRLDWLALLTFTLVLPVAAGESPAVARVTILTPGRPISPDLFGVFFEDLNYAADGGNQTGAENRFEHNKARDGSTFCSAVA
jgi:hypothetical protein